MVHSGEAVSRREPVEARADTDRAHRGIGRNYRSPERRGVLRKLALALAAVLVLAGVLASQADAAVYWGNTGTNSIGRANLDGSDAFPTFITGANDPTGVAVNGSYVYWVNTGNGTIGRANLDGTGVNQNFITGLAPDIPTSDFSQVFSVQKNGPTGLAVDGSKISWTTSQAWMTHDVDNNCQCGVTRSHWAGTIGRANLDGTGVNRSFITPTGDTNPCGIVSGASIYWADSHLNEIGSADTNLTAVNQALVSGANAPCGVAGDSTNIYWANQGDGTIGRASLNGTSANQSLITGANQPCGVAVNATNIYWANQGGGTIGRGTLDGTSANQSLITGASSPCGVAVDSKIVYSSQTSLACSPSSVLAGETTTCTATVSYPCPTRAGCPPHPTGSVGFSDGFGNAFYGNFGSGGTCALSPTALASQSSCQVTYTPAELGSRTITATYGGDGSYGGSAGSFPLAVSPRSTSTTVTCAPSSLVVAQSTTCTATMTDTSGTSNAPSACVKFSSDGPGTLGGDTGGDCFDAGIGPVCTPSPTATAGQSSCQVTYAPTGVGTGTHTISATYVGDLVYGASNGSFALSVAGRSTSTSVSCKPSQVVVSQSTTCAATVTDTGTAGSPSAPSGSVNFSSDTTGGSFGSTGTCTLAPTTTANQSRCQLTYTPGQVGEGTQHVGASYAGDGVHETSRASVPLTVGPRSTSTNVGCTPSSVLVGQGANCTATVADTTGAGALSAPTGSVSFASDTPGGNLSSTGICALSPTATPGQSSCQVTYTPGQAGSGIHQITASYGGDSTRPGSGGATSLTVSPRSTSTGVVCSPPSSAVSQPTICTATVADTATAGTPGNPFAQVNFSSDTAGGSFTGGGSCSLVPTGVADQSSCQVSYTPGQVGSGAHKITAGYGGDSAHALSTGSANVAVTQPAPTETGGTTGPGGNTGTGTTGTATVVGGGSPTLHTQATKKPPKCTRAPTHKKGKKKGKSTPACVKPKKTAKKHPKH